MKDFFINLFEYENFTLYLAIVIGVLIVAFFIVFFIGRKDQKNIERTQRLELMNNEEFNKNTTLITPATLGNVDTSLEISKTENQIEQVKEEPTIKSEDVFSNFSNLANSISSELDEMEKAQNKYNELVREQNPTVEVKEEVQEEIPIQLSVEAVPQVQEPVAQVETPSLVSLDEPDTLAMPEPIFEPVPEIVETPAVEPQPVFETPVLEKQETNSANFILPEAPVLPEEEKVEPVFEDYNINELNNDIMVDKIKEEPVIEPVPEIVETPAVEPQPVFEPVIEENTMAADSLVVQEVVEPITVPEFEPIVFENVSGFDDEKDAIININEIDNIKPVEEIQPAANPFVEEKKEEIISNVQPVISEPLNNQHEEQKNFTPSTVFSSVYAPNNFINTNNVIYDDEEEMEIELPRLK